MVDNGEPGRKSAGLPDAKHIVLCDSKIRSLLDSVWPSRCKSNVTARNRGVSPCLFISFICRSSLSDAEYVVQWETRGLFAQVIICFPRWLTSAAIPEFHLHFT